MAFFQITRLIKAERVVTHCIEELALISAEWKIADDYIKRRAAAIEAYVADSTSDIAAVYSANVCLERLRGISASLDSLRKGEYKPAHYITFFAPEEDEDD